MKFVMLVEGHTERMVLPSFLPRWLNPQLPQPIRIKPARVAGLKELVKKANLYLQGKKASEIIGVIGLLDLYGFKEFERGSRQRNDFYEFSVSQIEKQVNLEKFKMFFAVHETEAWLLSKPDLFPQELQNELSKHSIPEDVDFGEPPAKLLKRLYREKLKKSYGKTTDSVVLFENLDPQIAHDKCPYLRKMLDEMLSMAQAALSE